jgi:hypothetical protein
LIAGHIPHYKLGRAGVLVFERWDLCFIWRHPAYKTSVARIGPLQFYWYHG